VTRRAVGIVRVSETKGREGERFASPKDQRDRIAAACERDGVELVTTHEELDVSGGKPLDERPGLRLAVQAIESGEAQVIAAAYFDRLFRSLATQQEVIDRVEAAGGQVLAVDVGAVTNASAGQWLTGTMHGMISEYYRRSVRERSGEAQARAVARGVAPWPKIPPGYKRGPDGVLVPTPDAKAVTEAFLMRAEGTTIKAVRAFLADNGIRRSYHGVSTMLASRVVLGEIHFGKLGNLQAHEPIVEPSLWERVQKVSAPRGRRAKSERLLARLGILRCGTCGAKMVVGTANNQGYHLYRCPPTGDCTKRMTISARIAEELVTQTVRTALSDAEGRAAAAEGSQEAAGALEVAQAALDAALGAFTASGLENESAAIERLRSLGQDRDDAQVRYDQLLARNTSFTINADRDWDHLSLDLRRKLIRATVERAVVAPGKGASRIHVTLIS
jgi:DNA invertase Pin-like site-specific DNA recombinase